MTQPCVTKEHLANPSESDSEGQRCLIVGKDGNTTNLTIQLVSFTRNKIGIESVELGRKECRYALSAKGDLGSLALAITPRKS